MALTDTRVRQAKPREKAYRLADGNGLHLEVRPSGAKFWRYRYELPAGKESMFTVGEYPAVSLADARAQRDWAREKVRAGINPTVAREIERQRAATDIATTFRAVAEEWISREAPTWSEGYAAQLQTVFKADVFPIIGDRPIREVTASELLTVVRQIEARGASSIAVLVRQRCSSVFRYAVATQRADNDPAAALYGAIKRKPVRHHPHLTLPEIPKLLATMNDYGGYAPTRIAMRLLLLNFTRTGEIRQAQWDEFDLDGSRFMLDGPAWVIPAHRMKMRREHIVPLARQSVALLAELRALTGGQPLLFPNMRQPGKPMSITSINRALERMGFGGQFSGHGFRSTASTALHELGYDPDVIEAQLAHKDGTIRGVYNRARYLPERRIMMQAWADLVDRLESGGGEAVSSRIIAA